MPKPLLLAVCATLLIGGVAHAQSANPYARPVPAKTTTPQGSTMDDLKRFATDGMSILESKNGDLTGNGGKDVLLVLDPPAAPNAKLGEGAGRRVAVLVRDASGQLHEAASNDRIVPCATCGGMAGDPFGYTRIAPGQFTIVNGGGSRERWSDEYTFTYAPDKKDWFVSHVVRRVDDTETGAHKAVDLTAKELGSTTFKAFDPSHLPEATLP